MIEYRTVQCPWCGAGFDSQIDCSAGSQTYVEDCHACCQPIVVETEVDHQMRLTNLQLRREND
jgi:hypothetical protein